MVGTASPSRQCLRSGPHQFSVPAEHGAPSPPRGDGLRCFTGEFPHQLGERVGPPSEAVDLVVTVPASRGRHTSSAVPGRRRR
ncbi:protein of unknown function [Rhodovastum atsumiense]|nr:protein of unknown function [Rhodovastum atsumiense]